MERMPNRRFGPPNLVSATEIGFSVEPSFDIGFHADGRHTGGSIATTARSPDLGVIDLSGNYSVVSNRDISQVER